MPDEGAATQADEGGEKKVDLAAIQSSIESLQSTLDEERGHRQRIEGRLEERAQPAAAAAEQPKPEKKVYTRAELAQQVEAKRITQEQMDEILDAQLEERAERRAREIAQEIAGDVQTGITLKEQHEAYLDAHPDIRKHGSEDRQRLTVEMQKLVDTGLPKDSMATELAAMKIAFGPDPKPPEERTAEAAQHDTAGSGGGARVATEDSAQGSSAKSLGLTAREERYYDKQIAMGNYADWDEVKAERERKPSAMRSPRLAHRRKKGGKAA